MLFTAIYSPEAAAETAVTSPCSQNEADERCHRSEQQRQGPHQGRGNDEIRRHFPGAGEPCPGDGRVRCDHGAAAHRRAPRRLAGRARDGAASTRTPRESRASLDADFRPAPPSPSHRAIDLAFSLPARAFFFVIIPPGSPPRYTLIHAP